MRTYACDAYRSMLRSSSEGDVFRAFANFARVHILTKHSDPRSGDTTYSLSNIVRAEPALSLFDVPADYTVKRPGKRE